MKEIEILKNEINRIDEIIEVLMGNESFTASQALAYYREHMEVHVIALEEFNKLPCVSSEKFRLKELINVVENTIYYFIFEYFEDHTEEEFKQQYGLHFTAAMKQWYTFINKFKHYCSP
ncbi:hypothetical protein [Paenibacillus gallinarum]|uniref:Uncharacterized protein n=1 Tax=Paenibacillus gallinarum TaxID=2762232 RepID=A0ABR8ST58_9BACL|nr:hypothetical protein [Paenibacillus gallinarum]MBD7966676.1 hypothetical protein [Paenibacillus gallinarum]